MKIILVLLFSGLSFGACTNIGSGRYYCPSTGDVDADGVAVRDFVSNPANFACGSTILLDAGAIYRIPYGQDTGWILKPQTGCAPEQFTTITSTGIGNVPEGTQITPAQKAFTARVDTTYTNSLVWLSVALQDGRYVGANNWKLQGLSFTTAPAAATAGALGIGNLTPQMIANGPGFNIYGPDGLSYTARHIWIDRCLFFPIEQELYGPAVFSNTDGRAWSIGTATMAVAFNVWDGRLTNSYVYGFVGYRKQHDQDNLSTAGKTVTAATNANPVTITSTGISYAIWGVALPTAETTPKCDGLVANCTNVLIQGATGNWATINGATMAEFVDADHVRLWKPDDHYGFGKPAKIDSTAFGALTGTPVVYSANCCVPFYALQTDWGTWTVTNNHLETSNMSVFFGGNDTPSSDPATIVSSTGCNVLNSCQVVLSHVRNLSVGDYMVLASSDTVNHSIYYTGPPIYGPSNANDTLHRVGAVTAINGNTVSLTPVGPTGIDVAPANGGLAAWDGGIIRSMEFRRNAIYVDSNSHFTGKTFTEYKAAHNTLVDGNTYGPQWAGGFFLSGINQGGASPWMGFKNVRISNSLIGGPRGSAPRPLIGGQYIDNTNARSRNVWIENNVWPGITWDVLSSATIFGMGGLDIGGFVHNTTVMSDAPTNLYTGSAYTCNNNPNWYLDTGYGTEIKDNIYPISGGFTTVLNGTECWPAGNASTGAAQAIHHNVLTDFLSAGTYGSLFPGTGNVINSGMGYSFLAGSCAYATWENCGVSVASGYKGTASDGKDPGADIPQVKDRINGWSDDAGLLKFDTTIPNAVNNPAAFTLGSNKAVINFALRGAALASCTVEIYTDPARQTLHADTSTSGNKLCSRAGSLYADGKVSFVAGTVSGLTGATGYYYKITDGSRVMVGQFKTLPSGTDPLPVSVQLTDSSAASMQIEYSASADMTYPGTVSASFASNRAQATFSVPNGGIRYYRWKKLSSGAAVLATGPITVAVATAPPGVATALVQSKNCHAANTGVGSTSFTCSFDSLPAVGNTVMIWGYTYNTTLTFANNQSDTTTADGNKATPDGLYRVYVAHSNVAHSSGTYTFTVTLGANSYLLVNMYEWAGIITPSSVDQTATANNNVSQTYATVGPVTTTSANELLFVGTTIATSTVTWTPGSGYTAGLVQSNSATSTVVGGEEWQLVSSTGTYSADQNFATPAASSAQVMVTFKASSGGTGPTADIVWSKKTNTDASYPHPVGYQKLLYDPVSARVIYPSSVPASATIYSTDEYWWDRTNNTWSHIGTGALSDTCTADTNSQPGERHPVWQEAIDTQRNWKWIFGGVDQACNGGTFPNTNPRQDLYYLQLNATPTSATWHRVTPTHLPVPNASSVMEYDPDDDVLILMGPDGIGAMQVWMYCRTTENPTPGTLTSKQSAAGCSVNGADDWSQVTYSGTAPLGVIFGAIAHDTVTQKILHYGGSNLANSVFYNSMHAYDVPTKTFSTKCDPCAGPPVYSGTQSGQPPMAYDTRLNVLYIEQAWGTGAPVTWRYNPATNAWSTLSSSGTHPESNDTDIAYSYVSRSLIAFINDGLSGKVVMYEGIIQ